MTEVVQTNNKAVATVAVTASTAAVACGVCCVLPLALPAVIVTSFGSVFAFFERAYPWMRDVSVLAVSIGWLWVFAQSLRAQRRPARSTLIIMIVATAAMAVALKWPLFEDRLVAMLQ